jgi:hypothetical protein
MIMKDFGEKEDLSSMGRVTRNGPKEMTRYP